MQHRGSLGHFLFKLGGAGSPGRMEGRVWVFLKGDCSIFRADWDFRRSSPPGPLRPSDGATPDSCNNHTTEAQGLFHCGPNTMFSQESVMQRLSVQRLSVRVCVV